MILRRVIAHFRKQEWTAIGLDFLIVVAGVFVGLQVSNWNTAQADKRLGKAYTERLVGDLENDLRERRQTLAYYTGVLDSVERANALLVDPGADPQQLVVTAYRASEAAYSAPSRATWDEIVSAGDTGLLPPHAVENGIADYFAYDTAHDVLETMMVSRYRHRVRRLIPLELQKAIRQGCSDLRNEVQEIVGFMETCSLGIEEATVAKAAEALRADPEVLADLRYQYSDAWTACANLRGDVVILERALGALGQAQTIAGAP